VALNNYIIGKLFATDADVKQALTASLQTLDTDVFYIRNTEDIDATV
jgi:hypothetical protein